VFSFLLKFVIVTMKQKMLIHLIHVNLEFYFISKTKFRKRAKIKTIIKQDKL